MVMTKPGKQQSEKMSGLLRISIHTSGMVGNSSNAEERKSHLLLPSLHLLLISQLAVLTIDNITKDKINSIKLQVATDAGCNNITEVISAKIEDGDLIFKPTKSAVNNYYKFIFDCQAAGRNGLIQISKIAYYKVGDTPEIVDITNTAETAYTIAKAKELIDAGKGLSESVYVKGTVSQASKELNTTYGSLSYYISDDGTTGNELQVYGGLSFKGEKFTSVDDIKVGDVVVVYGKLVKYKTTYELDKDNILISLNGTTTGITNITTDEAAKNAPVYNLSLIHI